MPEKTESGDMELQFGIPQAWHFGREHSPNTRDSDWRVFSRGHIMRICSMADIHGYCGRRPT